MPRLLNLHNIIIILTLLLFTETNVILAFQKCHQTYPEDKIIVHLVPHSHDDVGWKETLDEYYNQGFIQVKNIYDTVFEALKKDSKRRFAFLWVTFGQEFIIFVVILFLPGFLEMNRL